MSFFNETRTAYCLLKAKTNNKKLENEADEKGRTRILINRKDTNTLSLLHNEDQSRKDYRDLMIFAMLQFSLFEYILIGFYM